jgi:hypothetical protein
METGMKLDVRTPIGAMFALDGAVLAIYGAVTKPSEHLQRAGGNITLYWGLALLVFGATMLTLAFRARKSAT